ncbi:hypothetical protein NHJ13051_006866 [Beauveria bassiana]
MLYTYHGFIQNFTQARDPCLQPHIHSLHGTFVKSISISTTVSRVEAGDATGAPTFKLLSAQNHSLPLLLDGKIGAWLSGFSDVSFAHLECFPEPPQEAQETTRHVYVYGKAYG